MLWPISELLGYTSPVKTLLYAFQQIKLKGNNMWNRTILGPVCSGLLLLFAVIYWTTMPCSAETSTLEALQAQAAPLIDLNQAFALAEAYNPKILSAQTTLMQAKANIGIAKEIPNPQLVANYGFGATTYVLGNPQQALLTQTLEVGGKRKARTHLAQSQLALAESQLNDLRQDIRSQVRQAYIDLLAAKETSKTLANQSNLLKSLLDIAKKRFEAGAAPESDVVQASLSYNQLIPLQASADGRIRQARIQLNTLVGKKLPANYDINDQEASSSKDMLHIRIQKNQLAPTLELPALDALTQSAFGQRYDFQAALQQVEVARKRVKVTESLRIPDLQVGSGYAFLYAPHNTMPHFNQGVFFTLGTNLPIYHNQKSELQRDRSAAQQAELQVIELKRQIENEVETAFAALQTAMVNVHLYEDKLLPQAEDLSQLAKMSYEVGKTGLPNVILAQQTAQQIRAGYLDAVISYHRSIADLEKALGGPLE
jgi:cobalt-zinc-cadmium efflux system outer membrane protein